MYTLAHISDLHATPASSRNPWPLLGKRGLGWLSWRLRRRHIYRPQVLEALLRDLQETRPDHLAITGDLTNVSLPAEFEQARRWLGRLGPPHAVTAIPGNHDAYVRVPDAHSWALWSDYLVSDASGLDLAAELFGEEKPEPLVFPTLRRVGPLALIGLCSAVPTPPLWATGRIGTEQLERLDGLLRELGARGVPRVVLVHHPPEPGATSARRSLDDGQALCDLLRRSGAELVLHGHLHRTKVRTLPGPARPIPVVGVRSASHGGATPEKLARYHLYDFTDDGAISLRAREYDPLRDAFAAVEEAPRRLGED